ncbi:MAG: hypothetical protein ANABAC_0160 [Anaerolineae bacterium]|nr:MAG: hypothetical protein ANABAC_0160 [Anaerolineae bacterium]
MKRPLRILKSLAALIALALALLLLSPAFALLGDVDLNNRIDQVDLNAIAQKLGLTASNPNYSRALDLSLDDKINVVDLAIAGRSYGAERIFHSVRQISNLSGFADQETCVDGLGRINIIWNDTSHGAFFSRLDRYGNTLIDDVKLASPDSSQPVGIGCDQQGNAHLVWIDGTDLYQARFDRWGYPVIQPMRLAQNYASSSIYSVIDVDLDSHGNAFAFFRRSWRNLRSLIKISPIGELDLATHGLLAETTNTTSLYHKIALDDQDNIHLMWYELEGPDRIYYARYGGQENASLPERVIGTTSYDGSVSGSREPDLGVDPAGNAYILWHTYGTPNLSLEKIAPDGSTALNDYKIFGQWEGNGFTPPPVLEVDESGNLHLLGVSGWGRSTSHSAYGRFNAQGEPIQPMRWFFYGAPVYEPDLVVDPENDVHVTFDANSTDGYPPCPDNALCYLGTSFNAAAYDLNRSDLGVDAAHLSFEPLIARWGGTLTITTTVFNEGWTASPASTLLVALTTEDGTRVAETQGNISSLAPHQSQNFPNLSLSLTTNPPAGLEEMEYLRLLLEVDAAGSIPETSEQNNRLSIPILVQKLPTRTGLFLIVEDETETARGGLSERVTTGTATISGGSYTKSGINVVNDVTILANDIPVTNDWVNYTIGWQASGYALPTPQVIGVRRNPSDPYRIDTTPGNTAVLKTNRWGSLSGTITAGATVRVVGEGLNIETTTNSEGIFSPAIEPKLAKLIPGSYQIRVSKAGYARLSETLTVTPLSTQTYNRTMETTTLAYLHGNVINAYDNPVAGATVNACGTITQTDAQGVFDLTVDAGCTSLSITRTGYANLSQSLSLTAGVETLLSDLTMSFNPPVTLLSKEDRVASRVIDQSTGDLLPDPPDDASWIEKKLFDVFEGVFWPSTRIYIAYGAYAYNAAVAYSGPPEDRRLQFVQVSFNPQTFEVHAMLPTIKVAGAPITIPIVSDSGIRSAILAIEARLVNVKTGQVVATIQTPIEGAASERIFDQAILTYNFGGQAIPDWENCEVWLYYKVGREDSGQFTTPPQLYQHDRQIMKFDLSAGTIWLDYGLGEFPLP